MIEAAINAGPLQTRTDWTSIQLVHTDMWTNGTAARLTEQNRCWPAEASFYQNIPDSRGLDEYASLAQGHVYPYLRQYQMSGGCISAPTCVEVSFEGIAEQCRSFLLGATLIQPTGGDHMYAETIDLLVSVIDGVEIKDILSREGLARVTYTLSWRFPESARMLGHTNKTRFKFIGEYRPPLEKGPVTAVLREFDQGWRVMCAPPASLC